MRVAQRLADHMTFTWKLEREAIGGKPHRRVQAKRVLNSQFISILEAPHAAAPPTMLATVTLSDLSLTVDSSWLELRGLRTFDRPRDDMVNHNQSSLP
jgi:hypothetical protein